MSHRQLLHKVLIASLMIWLGLSVSACKATRSKELNDTVKKYNNALRWKGYMSASKMVSNDMRKAFINEKIEELKDRNILEASVLDMAFNQEQTEAYVIVLYNQYLESTQTLTNVQERQVWKRDGWGWKLTSSETIGRK